MFILKGDDYDNEIINISTKMQRIEQTIQLWRFNIVINTNAQIYTKTNLQVKDTHSRVVIVILDET